MCTSTKCACSILLFLKRCGQYYINTVCIFQQKCVYYYKKWVFLSTDTFCNNVRPCKSAVSFCNRTNTFGKTVLYFGFLNLASSIRIPYLSAYGVKLNQQLMIVDERSIPDPGNMRSGTTKWVKSRDFKN